MNMEEKSDILTLYSNPLVVKNVIKKTKAKFWQEIQVGDQIIISLKLNKKYYGRGGWVPYYRIRVPERDLDFSESHNNTINRLMSFELESYNPDNRGILDLF